MNKYVFIHFMDFGLVKYQFNLRQFKGTQLNKKS